MGLAGNSVCKLSIVPPDDLKIILALVGVAQWIECQPANQRVDGSIPSLGHMPSLQARSPVGGVQKATRH